MEKIIYIVTSGDYSDYHIVGVFSSFEEAEGFQLSEYCYGQVEEWPVDAEEDVRVARTVLARGALLWEGRVLIRTGEITHIEKRSIEENNKESNETTSVDSKVRPEVLYILCFADTKEQAVKKVVEKRQAWLREHT